MEEEGVRQEDESNSARTSETCHGAMYTARFRAGANRRRVQKETIPGLGIGLEITLFSRCIAAFAHIFCRVWHPVRRLVDAERARCAGRATTTLRIVV